MSDYFISEIRKTDRTGIAQVDRLLAAEGIRRDGNLDYICGLFNDDYELIGTGSCFGNTLRCMAVSREHQGEGLLAQIITHLMDVQFSRGNTHLFVYTKCDSEKFFKDLGFSRIVRIEDQVVFMENRRDGFQRYLERLKRETAGSGVAGAEDAAGKDAAAVVMNANPFTRGHLHLVETEAAKHAVVHIFMVSEEASLVPFPVRRRLILEGTAHLKNLVFHDSGPYIISAATFPSYFQKDGSAVIESHARLDLEIFTRIAAATGITSRAVGEEPKSLVTGIYNRIMREELPKAGIGVDIIPRFEVEGVPVSASDVRSVIKKGDMQKLAALVPESTRRFFESPEAAPVIARIRAAENVVHY